MKEDVVDIDKFIKTVNRACVISEDMVEKIIDILVEGNR